MKYLMKIMAMLVSTAFLLSACSSGDTSWAFKSGQTQISPGLYILYQMTSFGEAEAKIAEGIQDYAGMKSSELLKQTVEDKPASDWIKDRATELVKEHIAVQEKFTSLGLLLSDRELASVERSLGSAQSESAGFYEKNGVSESTLREYYTGYARKSRLFTALYGEGGELAPAGDELKSYISENYAMIDALLMYKPMSAPEGETKTVEQLVAEQKANAEDYLARLRDGEEIEQLDYEWRLSQAADDQKSGVTKAEKGQLSMVISESMRTGYGDALTDSALNAKAGDSEMVEDDSFFLVFRKADIMESPEEYDAYKSVALQELKGEEYESKLADWASAAQIETNSATIERYKPEKIKVD